MMIVSQVAMATLVVVGLAKRGTLRAILICRFVIRLRKSPL